MANRMDRANSEIQKCLIEIIQHKMNDPRLDKIITISDVELTPDFKYCKVKVSVLDVNEIASITKILQKSEGYIKRELARMVKMPSVPKINFVIDKGTLSELRVEEILKTLNIPPVEDDSEE